MKPFAQRAVVAVATICFFGIPALASNAAGDTAPAPAFNGVSLSVKNSTIPPGGIFQFQLMLTEPKPIGNSSTRPNIPSGPTGPVRGISINDPLGVTAGVAVINDLGIQITATSPANTFGSDPNLDYPILTIAAPIRQDATIGNQYSLSIDLTDSLWLDPSGQAYAQEIKPGRLTIGGTMAISDVVPGGGFLPAGTQISVLGMGFTPDSSVDISGVSLTTADFQFISPNQMDVIVPQGLQMDGQRVRVRNPGGEVSTYFSYLRTQNIGQSSHTLVAESYPLFARQTFTQARLSWSRAGSSFTALALQNPSLTSAEVTLEMLSTAGQVLASTSVPLPAYSKMTRDLLEFFPQPPDSAVSVRISSNLPIQILGLLGDDATGNVAPVIVSVP